MIDPTAELQAAVSELVQMATAKPNDARTFAAVVARLERWPGMDHKRALAIAQKNFPGSARAFRQREAERHSRLLAAVRRGRIN